ncbi:hypothetical protein GCM10023080_086430 [Streptomyces pseudoechinosporeus]
MPGCVLGSRLMDGTALRARLLGGMDLRNGERRLGPLDSARAESLLAYLLLHWDAPQPITPPKSPATDLRGRSTRGATAPEYAYSDRLCRLALSRPVCVPHDGTAPPRVERGAHGT